MIPHKAYVDWDDLPKEPEPVGHKKVINEPEVKMPELEPVIKQPIIFKSVSLPYEDTEGDKMLKSERITIIAIVLMAAAIIIGLIIINKFGGYYG